MDNGKAIADAAHKAGVPRLVYSSVGGAERHTGIPHFDSKREVEEHIQSLGLAATFVRPVFFMDNFAAGAGPKEEDGELVLRMPFPAGVPLQMVAVDDVGKVAATLLLDPEALDGDSVEIAGDELTGEQIAAVFGHAAAKPARFEELPLDVLGDDADQRAMFARSRMRRFCHFVVCERPVACQFVTSQGRTGWGGSQDLLK